MSYHILIVKNTLQAVINTLLCSMLYIFDEPVISHIVSHAYQFYIACYMQDHVACYATVCSSRIIPVY